MLAELLPIMTDTVQHWLPPLRDRFGGAPLYNGHTDHRARVVRTPGEIVAPASKDLMAITGTTVWLFDHPRPIAVGDTFKLDTGETLNVVRVERRAMSGAALSKVYLK